KLQIRLCSRGFFDVDVALHHTDGHTAGAITSDAIRFWWKRGGKTGQYETINFFGTNSEQRILGVALSKGADRQVCISLVDYFFVFAAPDDREVVIVRAVSGEVAMGQFWNQLAFEVIRIEHRDGAGALRFPERMEEWRREI